MVLFKLFSGFLGGSKKYILSFLLGAVAFHLGSFANAGGIQVHYEQVPQQIYSQSSGFFTKFGRAISDIKWRGRGDDVPLFDMYGDHYSWDIKDPIIPRFRYAWEFAPPRVTSYTGQLVTTGTISRVYGRSEPIAAWLDAGIGLFGFGLFTCPSQVDYFTCRTNNELGRSMQTGPYRYFWSGFDNGSFLGDPLAVDGNNIFRAFYDETYASVTSPLFTGTDINYQALYSGFDHAQWITSTRIDYFTQNSQDPVKSLDISAFSIFPGWGNSVSYVAGQFNYSSGTDYGNNLEFYTTKQYTTSELNNPQVTIGGWKGFLAIPVYDLDGEQSIVQGKTLVLAKSPANNPSAGPIPTLGGIQYTVYDCVSSDPYVLSHCPYDSAGLLTIQAGQTTGLLQGGYCGFWSLIYENNCPSMYLFYTLGMDMHYLQHQNFTFGHVASEVTSTGVFFPAIPIIDAPSDIIDTEFWFGFEAISGYPPILGGQAPGTNFSERGGSTINAGTIGALTVPFCQGGNCINVLNVSGLNIPSSVVGSVFTGDINQISGFIGSGFQFCSDETWASLHPQFCGALYGQTPTGYQYTLPSSTQVVGIPLFGCPDAYSGYRSAYTYTLADLFGVNQDAWDLVKSYINDPFGSIFGYPEGSMGYELQNGPDSTWNILGPFSCWAGAASAGFDKTSLVGMLSGYDRVYEGTGYIYGGFMKGQDFLDWVGNGMLAFIIVFIYIKIIFYIGKN